MKKLIALAALALTLSTVAELPPLEFPQGVGVNIHFTRGHERDLDLIAAAGFKFIRMDFGWGGIERRKGEYDWSAYDELTANLEKRGLRAIYIFDYSNGLYEDTVTSINPMNGKEQRDVASLSRPESVAAFAAWAAAAAKHFQGKPIVWEIYNEPNISFWKPKPNVKDYSALVLATCKAVHATDPNATIVGPASSEFPWSFLEELFKAGALEHLDAVSVHPYRSYSRGPETAAEDFLKLRALIERYAPANKKNMPILSGEWGYASHSKGVSLEMQAAFIARQQIANVWQGVPISIWYDWKNDGTDPAYNEHHFGTVSNDLTLKPSYLAVQTMTRELNGFHIARRLDSADEDFIFLLVNKNGAQKIVAWTTDTTSSKPHTIPFPGEATDANDVSAVNGQGKPLTLKFADGILHLPIGSAPRYFTLKKPSAALRAAASWSVATTPTLIETRPHRTTNVVVSATNIYDRPVTVVFTLARGEEKARLVPGENVTRALTLPISYRGVEPLPYRIKVELREPSVEAKVLSTSSEERHYIAENPISFSVAPIERGLRFQVENPSGVAFHGYALSKQSKSAERYYFQMAAGTTQGIVDAPDAAISGNTFQLGEEGTSILPEITNRFSTIKLATAKAQLEGDAKVPATAALLENVAAPGEHPPYTRAYELKYDFDPGWRFVQINVGKTTTIEGKPRALGLWVYGDNSGCALRMRVVDSRGQTFQPSGPSLNWIGWRWVEFNLADLSHAGHWGGPNDGMPRGPLRLDVPLIVDSTRKKTLGKLYFAEPTWIYAD